MQDREDEGKQEGEEEEEEEMSKEKISSSRTKEKDTPSYTQHHGSQCQPPFIQLLLSRSKSIKPCAHGEDAMGKPRTTRG